MSIEELNALVEDAYAAGLAYTDELARVYLTAFDRAAQAASKKFSRTVVTASAQFVPPPVSTLTSGMTEEEQKHANDVRDRAAAAIAATLTAIGLGAIAVSFMQAISQRGSDNFDRELLLVLRNTIDKGLNEGWTADETALALRDAFSNVSFTTAGMLAETELTSLVNERALAAAMKSRGEGGPTYKVWQTMKDPKVRPAHASVQGQTVPIDQPFDVSGYKMNYPGDPSAPMRLVARCRCRMSYSETMVAAGAAFAPSHEGMAMVAVYPRGMQQQLLSREGGQLAETIHCTMMFLGDVSALDLDALHAGVATVAARNQALQGTVGGTGVFQAGEDGHPMIALPSVAGLSTLREDLALQLSLAGIESASEYGWMPHITLAYVDEPMVDTNVFGQDLHFDTISVVVADERTDYRLGGLTASAEEANVSTVTDSLAAAITITIDDSEAADTSDSTPGNGGAWKALLAIEGQQTEDGRIIDPGALSWRDLPLSLMAMDQTGPGGHEGAQVAGRIDRVYRDGNNIFGEGEFTSDEFGQHIEGLVGEQALRGNSVDLAVLSYEYRNALTGEPLSDEDLMDAFFGEDIPILFAVTEGVILASTVCPTPAIAGAEIMLASGIMRMTFSFAGVASGDVLTAAGAGMAPLHPPTSWFSNPKLTGPTPLTVTPEGKVLGHAALWDSCHIGEPSGPGVCVPPPRSGMQYEIFHHGVVTTDDGIDIPCGQITMSTFHAGRDLGWKATLEHYEHSGCAVADVVAGEDSYGIWVSGGLRPDLPAERVREMKAGALSGDWRDVIGRGLEFLAALVVNIPGFPVARPEARIVASATGEEIVLAVIAAGMVTPEDVEGMTRREYLRKLEALTAE